MTRGEDGDDGDAPVDLAAILRSEKLLSDLSERREPGEPGEPERAGADDPEPLRLLAALAADVDDDARTDTEIPARAPGVRRRMRGRKWVAAMIGLAAAVGTTGVAAAGTNVLTPIGGLFGAQSKPTTVAGTGRAAADERTAAPSRRATSRRAEPAHKPGDQRPTNYAPAGDSGAPIGKPTSTLRSAAEPGASLASSKKPTSAPSRGHTPTATPSPTGTNHRWPTPPQPPKPRIERGLGGLLGPLTSSAGDDTP